MRMRTLIAFLGVLLLAGATAAWAQTALELSPYEGPYDGTVVDVPPGDIETLYFHITEPGLWHVQDYSFHWESSDPTGMGTVKLIDPMVVPTTEYQGSVWYPFGVIQVDGVPSTTFTIQIDLTLQQPAGTVWSNPIYKHITPEPSSLLALGTGALGIGGLLLRRRRS